MEPLTIVIAFDVAKQVAPSGIPIAIPALMDEFGFPRAEEALHRCMSEQFAFWLIDWRPQEISVAGGVLAAAIRVMDKAGWQSPPLWIAMVRDSMRVGGGRRISKLKVATTSVWETPDAKHRAGL